MRKLSLRVHILIAMGFSVLVASLVGMNSSWNFISHDKIASVREQQSLNAQYVSEKIQNHLQFLLLEFRNTALDSFTGDQMLGKNIVNAVSTSGIEFFDLSLVKTDPSVESRTQIEFLKPENVNSEKSTWHLKFVEILPGKNNTRYKIEAHCDIGSLIKELEKTKYSFMKSTLLTSLDKNTLIEIYADSTATNKNYHKTITLKKIEEVTGNGVASQIEESDLDKTYTASARIKFPYLSTPMFLQLSASEGTLFKEFRMFIIEQAYIFLLVLLGSLILAAFFAKQISDPILELVRGIKSLRHGNLLVRVSPEKGQKEVRALAQTFNILGESLYQREQALDAANKNISKLSYETETLSILTNLSKTLGTYLDPDKLIDSAFNEWIYTDAITQYSEVNSLYIWNSEEKKYTLQGQDIESSDFPGTLPEQFYASESHVSFENFEVTEPAILGYLTPQNPATRYFLFKFSGESRPFALILMSIKQIPTEIQKAFTIEAQKIIGKALHNALAYTDLREKSIRDGLTGLFNVSFFKECFEDCIVKARENNQPLSFLFFDVDHFKKYNDTHGHPAGDKVLRTMGSLMRASFDTSCVLARYGGEEFVVLLKNTSHTEAMGLADHFREVVEKSPFDNEHTQPLGKLTVSIGVSTFPEHGQVMKELIQIADEALYKAKKASRNVVVSADIVVNDKKEVA